MKKFLLSILTVLYMTVSSGIAMEVHYCMGERAGFDLYSGGNKKCGRCGMKEKKGGCCSDEIKFIKLSDDYRHVATENILIKTFAEIDLITGVYQFTVPSHAGFIKNHSISDPPDCQSTPLYIINCIYRI